MTLSKVDKLIAGLLGFLLLQAAVFRVAYKLGEVKIHDEAVRHNCGEYLVNKVNGNYNFSWKDENKSIK